MIPDSWRQAALTPARAWGAPLGTGKLRSTPEDFVVDEILGFAAGGEGPHALLRVRKRGANTEWVARELARAVGCKPFDVGFAGLKDRHAVTTQHFTVPRGRREAAEFVGLSGDGYEVLEAAAHQRKLPRGALAGNRFVIVVRELDADPAMLRERIGQIATAGVPNYFGPQRFGREAGNLQGVLDAAAALASGSRGRSRRHDQGFVLSAARSLVFNAVLSRRVAEGSWHRLIEGDVANLDGRGSVFPVEAIDATLDQRCAAQEIHPTGPLPGSGEPLVRGPIETLERDVMAQFPEAMTLIASERLNAERRPLRIRVRDLQYDHAPGELTLRFALDAGSFATTVLREIIDADDTRE